MAEDPSRELYRRWLDELWNGSAQAAHDLVTDDFVGHWPDRDVVGPAELAAIIEQTQRMFDWVQFDLQVGPLVDGELVAARWTGVGHTSAGPAHFFGNDILRVTDGRFAEYWVASSGG